MDAQVTPIRVAGPVTDQAFDIALGGIGTRVGAEDRIALLLASSNAQFATNNARTPGTASLTALTLKLPEL